MRLSRRSLVIGSTAGLLLLAGVGGAAPHVSAQAPVGADLEALAQPPTYGAFASQRIYFVLPDRYANGDPRTTEAASRGRARSRATTRPTRVDHGGDLKGLTGSCADTRPDSLA